MRTSDEVYALLERIARADGRIRVMTLEGSRVNPNAASDAWQDYDVTFLVTDVASFTCSDAWLAAFGDLVFMQKPEAMELFPPDFPDGWFSYLMLFSDGLKIDLTLVPVKDALPYFEQDPLIEVLLDKDGIAPRLPPASDERFWVQKPTAACVDDCANEFFLSCTYVARGLLRDELLFANGVFDEIVRVELRRMLGYLAGARSGFPLNTGKRDKFLLRFLTEGERADLFATYRLDTVEAAWSALHGAMDLFERAVQETCATLAYPCPAYGAPVEGHIEALQRLGR